MTLIRRRLYRKLTIRWALNQPSGVLIVARLLSGRIPWYVKRVLKEAPPPESGAST
jgi:hypothetical protein